MKEKNIERIDGVDNILDDENFSQENYSSVITEAVVRAYAVVMSEREEKGNIYRGFSRKDYEKYRREQDPHYRSIERVLGSWTLVKNIIPVNKIDSKQKVPWEKYSLDNVYQLFSDIAKYNGVPISKITISNFDNYRDNHRHLEIPRWISYAHALGYGYRWKEMVRDTLKKKYIKDSQGRR